MPFDTLRGSGRARFLKGVFKKRKKDWESSETRMGGDEKTVKRWRGPDSLGRTTLQ